MSCVSDANEEYEIKSGSIVLCAGGFQANAEMRARYLGPNADLMKVRGSRHDTGEVLMMTLAMGAKPPVIGKAPTRRRSIRPFPTWRSAAKPIVTVTLTASRSIPSGSAFSTKAKRAILILTLRPVGPCSGQPGALAYQIYDQKTTPLLGNRYEFSTPIEAQSIDELAGKIGIEPDRA